MESPAAEQQAKSRRVMKSVFVALFAALISAGAFIAVPIGPLPIVLQNMLVVLAGALLGPLQGAGATGLFLIAGALGLPIFSGGRGGFAHLMGPTGGFLAGYFLAALVAGLIAGMPSAEKKTPLWRIAVACAAGFIVMYIPGVPRFQAVLDVSFSKAMAAAVIPFLPGDLIKLVVCIPLAAKLRPVIARYIAD